MSGQFEGVHLTELSRVFALLRDQLPRVLAANRMFEERTGIHNQSGTNNLVDALSHLGTLVKNAEQLGQEGQAEQVAHFEDHLRRSMMEAFEQIVRMYLGHIGKLWDEHSRRVRPLILAGELPGVAPIEELEALRLRVRDLLHDGRQTKLEPTWESWERGTDAFILASDEADRLRRLLEEGLAAAEREEAVTATTRTRRLQNAAIAASVVGGVIVGVVLGLVL